MSHRFWLISAATIGAAAICGLGLGRFVTMPPRALPESSASLTMPVESVATGGMEARGPALGPTGAIHCTGCGPTLAQRQMAAADGGSDADGYIEGTRDPAVRDYLADEPPVTGPPPPTPVRLPADVARFAASNAGASPPAVRSTIAAPVGAAPIGAAP